MKRELRRLGFVWLAAGAFCTFLSCAGIPGAYAPLDESVRSGSYERALAALDNEKGAAHKLIYPPRNNVLFYLDRGMIKHYAEQFTESSRDLETAEHLIEAAFTKSISQEIGSYLTNDNVKDYSGEDYEDLYINVFNSLNYYHNNDLEGALVEIRRLNEKLLSLSDKYERAKEKVLSSNQQIDTGQLPMEASKFSNSALARYLGILFYRATDRMDSVRIDYENLLQAYELAPQVYTNRIPSSVEAELSVPPGMGRLNVIAFTGLSPVKEEENIYIPLPLPPPNNMARLSLPRMIFRPQTIQRAEVVLDSGQRFNLELIENMGAVARETFKSRYGLTVLKTTARTITKSVTSATIATAVSKREEKGSGLGSLLGFFGRIYSDVSEQADIRLSRFFPGNALVGGINLEPGFYNTRVNFYGINGLVFSELKEITVRERSLNLAEFICLR